MSDSTGTRCEVCSPPSPRSSGRVASAAVNVGRALGFAELVAELELEEELAEEEDE
jgi:hypothetical protein